MEILVHACDRAQITDIIRMRDKGLTQNNIAGRVGRHHMQIRRYIRLYDRYGIVAFIP
jgi:transcriptional regulator